MTYSSFIPASIVLPRPIALVGMPGCGKSTIGRALAAHIEHIFIDADAEMVRRSGHSISALFAQHGEAVFRRYERWTLRSLVNRYPAAVLAAGGGAFADAPTRHFLQEHTLTLWLEVPLAALQERLNGDTQRPLLAGSDGAARLAALYQQRTPLYQQAALRIDAHEESKVVVERIVRALRRSQF